MGISRLDRRGQRVRGGKQKHDDYYRIRIVMFLHSHSSSNMSQMVHNNAYGLGRMNKGSLKILLEKMIEDGWIKKHKDPHAKNVTIYELASKGQEMGTTILQLRKDDANNALFHLETFSGIKSLGLASD